MFRVSRESTDLSWTDDDLLQDATKWSNKNFGRSIMILTKRTSLVIAIGAVLSSLGILVWARRGSHRTRHLD